MNKLFIFLFFISFSAIGQAQNQITLLPSKTEIKTPITVDLNNYTHIVSSNLLNKNFKVGIILSILFVSVIFPLSKGTFKSSLINAIV